MPEKTCHRTSIGGQALIEGIIMRGPEKSAIVVRKSDQSLVIEEKGASAAPQRAKILKLPFIRGMFNLYDSLKDGISALNFSAQFFEEGTEEELSNFEKWIEKRIGAEKFEKYIMGTALLGGILIPIALFILLPTLLAGFFESVAGNGVVRNLIEGAIRIVIFLCFLAAVSKMKDIQRTFAYHGAEHKSIFCYEKGFELNVENVRAQSRLHPRCGTSFLFVVMIISILVFSLFTWSNPWIRVLMRLLLIPVVVGISYEINRFAGRHDNSFTMALRAPGIWLQHLTTKEPDDSMIEVAIEALKRVIPEEKGADEW